MASTLTTATQLSTKNPTEMISQHDVFQQIFESLVPDVPSASAGDAHSLLDEWLAEDLTKTGLLSSDSSVTSSPEIATPLDVFLTSPTAKSDVLMFSQHNGFASPLFDDLSGQPSPATTVMSAMHTPHVKLETYSPEVDPAMDMFADLQQQAILSSLGSQLQHAPLTSQTTPATQPKPTRKRDASVVTDGDTDDAAVKRQKNTDAARRSRLKKVMRMECLETRVAELERMNSQLLLRSAVLDSEKAGLEAKAHAAEQRIHSLEQQLIEAHKALTTRI
jgi:Basic region leucine zipper